MAQYCLFSVKRGEPELVGPAIPTPHELKQLSDIDDQSGLRFHMKVIFFYKNVPSMEGRDPVMVIKEALGRALVYYYPIAGRLREGSNGKLFVDCSGEGVIFIEAFADIRLDQLGDTIVPPCPVLEDVLFNVPGSDGIVGCPLLLIQVTRLACGGFIMALRMNHLMCDALGLAQFLKTVAQMAHGATVPSIPPVWQRELLNAREPPRITYEHHEYEEKSAMSSVIAANNNIIHRSFFFSSGSLKRIRTELPKHLAKCSSYELLTGFMWKCVALALKLDPEELFRVSRPIDARGKQIANVPIGFYGNAIALPAAVSKSKFLCEKPLSYAVELVKAAKDKMSTQYIHSVADLMVSRGRPPFKTAGLFIVSDTRLVGFGEVDFGWGFPVFVGLTVILPVTCVFSSYKNVAGYKGIVALLCLPQPAMKRFEQEFNKLVSERKVDHKSLSML